MSGPTHAIQVRRADAARFGFTTRNTATTVRSALLGSTSSYVLQGDRVMDVWVMVNSQSIDRLATLANLQIRTPTGALVRLKQVARLQERADQVELSPDNLRQDDVVSARLEGIDLGTAMRGVRATFARDNRVPPGTGPFWGSTGFSNSLSRTDSSKRAAGGDSARLHGTGSGIPLVP